jgi:hypothetical protein
MVLILFYVLPFLFYTLVLWSYGSRVCRTSRSSKVYLNEQCCEAMVGERVTIVLQIANNCVMVDKKTNNNVCNELFSYSSANRGKLLIIAIPYKEGQHFATKQTNFMPVINQLQKMHSYGYAHGDI